MSMTQSASADFLWILNRIGLFLKRMPLVGRAAKLRHGWLHPLSDANPARCDPDKPFTDGVGKVAGFSLHAGVATKAHERDKLLDRPGALPPHRTVTSPQALLRTIHAGFPTGGSSIS